MKMDLITKAILDRSEKAGKTYGFDDKHDRTVPAQMWFQESDEGLILFIVFYTLACRWSRCVGCNLPMKMSSRHIPFKGIMAQIDHVFALPEVVAKREAIRKVIVSNNGSVLDEATFSSSALVYLLAQLNLNLPNLTALTIETRPEYVDICELEFLARALAEGETSTRLEIAVGFEAFDDRIRNSLFDKGLSLEVFERLVSRMAPFKFRLKCYFMQKPVPGISDEEAVADIQAAIDYLSDIASKHDIEINMHLNPTYAAVDTPLEEKFHAGEFTPPLLGDVARAALRGKGKRLSVFIGLSDEGLATQGGSFIREGDEELLEQLQRFNVTQDYGILEKITG